MSQVIALITGLALRTLRSAGLQAAYVAQPSLPPVRKTERKRQLRRQRQLARDIRGDIAEELNQLGTKSSWMQTANAAEAFGGVGYTIGDEGDEGVVDAVAGDDKEVERPAPGRETLEAQGKRLAADIARAEKQLGAMLGALVADEVPGAVRQRALSLVNWLSQAEADLAALRREWLSLEASTCTTGSRRVNLDADPSDTLGADFGCYLSTQAAQEQMADQAEEGSALVLDFDRDGSGGGFIEDREVFAPEYSDAPPRKPGRCIGTAPMAQRAAVRERNAAKNAAAFAVRRQPTVEGGTDQWGEYHAYVRRCAAQREARHSLLRSQLLACETPKARTRMLTGIAQANRVMLARAKRLGAWTSLWLTKAQMESLRTLVEDRATE